MNVAIAGGTVYTNDFVDLIVGGANVLEIVAIGQTGTPGQVDIQVDTPAGPFQGQVNNLPVGTQLQAEVYAQGNLNGPPAGSIQPNMGAFAWGARIHAFGLWQQ